MNPDVKSGIDCQVRDSASDKITVLIVEDHSITRLGLKLTLDLSPGLKVIGEADNGDSAIMMAKETRPRVVLMDIGLPIIDGLEAVRRIKADLPTTRILMLTSHNDEEDIYAALDAGADGYCLKDILPDDLVMAITSVAHGAAWLDPGIIQCVLRRPMSLGNRRMAVRPRGENKYQLSTRELEVLQLLVEGLSNQGIADRLFISAETAKTHVRHIMEKLLVSDRTKAATKAIKEGLVDNLSGQ